MEKGSTETRAAIIETINNQIRDNNPQEVKVTFNRLVKSGKTKEEAIDLIGCALAVEIFEILKYKRMFNESRYVANLKKLPKLPS